MSAEFDPNALKELFELDEDLVASLFEDFKIQGPELIEKIKIAVTNYDFKALELNAHSLKTSCKSLGFLKMSDLCLKIELAAENQKIDSDAIAELNQSLEKSREFLDIYLKNRTN